MVQVVRVLGVVGVSNLWGESVQILDTGRCLQPRIF